VTTDFDPGARAALATLREFAARGRDAPRTLLLAGPEGVGRRDVARWYAALRNCAARLDDPCGRCAACRTFVTDPDGAIPSSDYREVGPATTTQAGKEARRPQIRLDQLVARERGDPDPLGPWLARAPNMTHRVGVIDRAETMTEEAANAFLKVLEQPPAHATILLIAPGPDALIATVASRCAVVRLPPATPDDDVRAALAPHPALRLGRASAWRAALADPQTTEAKRAAVAAFVAAMHDDLASAFAAAETLAEQFPALDAETPGLLREAWRAEGAACYAICDAALSRLEADWAAYAPRDLALRAFVLTIRAGLRSPP
jgi:DNA polymerase III subunit delta'